MLLNAAKCILLSLTVALSLPLIAAGQEDDIWPRPNLGRGGAWPDDPFYFNHEGDEVIDLGCIIEFQALLSEWAPQHAILRMRREQVVELYRFAENMRAEFWKLTRELELAKEAGDERAVELVHAKLKIRDEIATTIDPGLYKAKYCEVLDDEQLRQLKSLALNAVIEKFGMEKMIEKGLEKKGIRLTEPERDQLRQAILEAELIAQREIVRLQQEAWAKVAKHLPPGGVEAEIERSFGFDGLRKRK